MEPNGFIPTQFTISQLQAKMYFGDELQSWRKARQAETPPHLISKKLRIFLTREIWRRLWHCLTLNVIKPKDSTTNGKDGNYTGYSATPHGVWESPHLSLTWPFIAFFMYVQEGNDATDGARQ